MSVKDCACAPRASGLEPVLWPWAVPTILSRLFEHSPCSTALNVWCGMHWLDHYVNLCLLQALPSFSLCPFFSFRFSFFFFIYFLVDNFFISKVIALSMTLVLSNIYSCCLLMMIFSVNQTTAISLFKTLHQGMMPWACCFLHSHITSSNMMPCLVFLGSFVCVFPLLLILITWFFSTDRFT